MKREHLSPDIRKWTDTKIDRVAFHVRSNGRVDKATHV